MQLYESNLKEKEIELLSSKESLLQEKQQKSRQKLIWLTVSILIIFTALLLIMILYFNKEKAFALLVQKNMELIKLNESASKPCNEKLPETDEKDIELAQAFKDLLHTGSLYRNQDISLDNFAELLHTNRAYLSKAINQTMHKNFSVVINQYRIQEACKMLVNPKYNYLSIEGIASTVGFNSKTSFNRVFKTETGITPSDFRNNQVESQFVIPQN
jgi:AraC-like DNA-binding protein